MDENKFIDRSSLNDNLSGGSLEIPQAGTSVYSASEAEPYVDSPRIPVSRLRFNKRAVLITAGIGTLVGIVLIGLLGLFLTKNNNNQNKLDNSVGSYASTTSPLSSANGVTQLPVSNAQTLAVNGQLLVNKTLVLAPSATPTTATPGELYYNSATNTPYFYNGSAYVSLTPSALPTHVTSVGGVSGVLALGSSLTVSGDQLSVAANLLQAVNSNTQSSRVSTIQGQTGNVTFAAGNGISINGTTISSTAIQSLQAGNGIAVNGNQIVNSGVVALTSTGNSIKITPEGNGVFDLENANGGGSGVTSLSSNDGSLTITNDGSGGYNAQVAPTGVSASSYGSASTAAIFTVNAAGQLTSVSTTPISISGGQITSGTITNTYLSSDVALYDRATSNFSGNLEQAGYGVCTTSGNCVGVPGGSIGGSGTSGTISMFTGLGYTIGNSSLNQVSGNLVDSGNLNVQGTGGLTLGSGSATATIEAASSGTPSFTLPANTGSSGQCLSTDGNGVLSFANCLNGSSSGSGGVSSLNGLSGSLTLAQGTGILVSNGASTISISLNTSGVSAGTYGSAATAAVFTVNAEGQLSASSSVPIALNGDQITSGTINNGYLENDVALYDKATSNFTGSLEQSGNDVCTTAGNCSGSPGESIGGGGTTGVLPVFTGSGYTIGDSVLSQSDGDLTDSGYLAVEGSGGLIIGSGTATATLESGSVSPVTFTLPNSEGTSGQCLTTDGSSNGILSFENCVTGGGGSGVSSLNSLSGALNITQGSSVSVTTGGSSISIGLASSGVTANSYGSASAVAAFTVNAEGQITSANSTPIAINGDQITTGTVGDSFLSSNVALYDDATSNFTGDLEQGGNDVCTTAGNCTGVSGGAVGGSGTSGTLALFTGSGYTIGDSALTETSGNLTASGNLSVQGTNGLTLGSGTATTTILGSSSSAISLTLPSTVGTSGQCLTTGGTGGVLSFSNCLSGSSGGGGGVASLNGLSGAVSLEDTNSQLTFGTVGQDINIHLPQALATTSTPTFSSLTLTNPLTIGNGGTGQNSAPSSGDLLIGTSTGTYALSNLTAGTGVSVTNGSGSITLGLSTTTVAAGSYGDAADVASFTVNAEGQLTAANAVPIAINGNQITSGTVSNNRLNADVATYDNATSNFTGTLQQAGNDVCTMAGNCTGVSGGAIGGSGSAGTIAMFTGSGYTIGNSALTQTGGNLADSGDLTVQGNGGLILGSGSDTTALISGSSSAISFTLPSSVGTSGQCLTTGGTGGALSFANCLSGSSGGSGGVVSLNGLSGSVNINQGTGLTVGTSSNNVNIGLSTTTVSAASYGSASNVATFTVNAEGQLTAAASTPIAINGNQITSGTVGNTYLNSDVSLYDNATSNFTGTLQQAGNDVCTTAGNCTGVSGGAIGGSGAAGDIAMFTGSGYTIGNSALTQTGGNLADSGDLTVQGNGGLILGSGSDTTALISGSSSAISFTLPSSVGTSGQCLTTGGTGGVLSFNNCLTGSSGGSGGVSSLNSLSGSVTLQDTSGTLTFTNSGQNIGITLAATTVSPNSYGSATAVATFTVNGKGQLTAAGSTPIAINGNQITSGSVAVAQGGTGITSYTTGSLLYASGSTTLNQLADGTTGQCLTGTGATSAPSWGSCGSGLGGSGTAGQIALFNTSSSLTGSVLTQTSGNLTSTGNLLVQPATNSTSAFVVEDNSNDTVLKVDTTDDWVGINDANPSAALDVQASSPAFFDGFETGTIAPFSDAGDDCSTNWYADDNNADDGNYVAYAAGGSYETCNLSITETLSAAGTVSFWDACTHNAGSETFYIDGTGYSLGCGTPNGTYSSSTYSYPVSSGTHTFEWNVNATPGNMGVELDDVKITNAGQGIAALLSGGDVGIGTAFPGNLLSVGALTTASSTAQIAVSTGGTTNSGIVAQDVAGQSAGYAFQLQNSSGISLASIDYQGNLNVQNLNVQNINGVGTLTMSAPSDSATLPASPTTTLTGVSDPRFSTSGNLCSNGRTDLAAVSRGNNSVLIYCNTGSTGSAALPTTATMTLTTATSPVGITTGNLCGNGRADLAVTNGGSSSISIYCNTGSTGSAAFSSTATTTLTTGSNAWGLLATGNLCGNGRADLVVANYGISTASVYCNTGSTGAAAFSATATTTLTTGSTPVGITTGNLCGNGLTDIAIANGGSNNITLYCNTGSTGSAAFSSTATTTLTTGSDPESLTAGNLCGNGRLDLAAPNYNSSSVSIFCNTGSTGSAAFSTTATMTLTAGGGTFDVSVGNFCGYGRSDLAVTNYSSNDATIYCNTGSTGSAAFSSTATTTLTTGSGPIGITAGNLCGNGRSDIATSNNGSSNISVYCNTSSSTTPPDLLDLESNSTLLDSVNNSGDMCLLTSTCAINGAALQDNGTKLALFQTVVTGSAAYNTTASTGLTTGTNPFTVTTGNLCGNNRTDLAVANYGSTSISIYCNTGSTGAAAFSATATMSLTTGTNPDTVTTGNLCGNNRTDLAVTNRGSSTVSVYCNTGSTGSAAFSATATMSLTTGTNPDTITTGNLCGDGLADLAVANYSSNTASVYCNTGSTGSAAFSATATKTLTTGGNPWGITTGNLCGNGLNDLVVTNSSSNTAYIYCNTGSTGSAAFSATATKTLTTGNNPVSVTTGNLCGNGLNDLAVDNYNTTTASIYCNTGSTGAAAFSATATKTLTTGNNPWGITTGNLCGDGLADLAVTNYSNTSNSVSVYCNTGSTGAAAFSATATKTLATGSDPQGITTGNLCGNGLADLAVTNYGSSNASIYCNTGVHSGSTTALQVQNEEAGDILDVDTINSRIGIGTNAPGNLLSIGALTTAAGTYQIAVSTGGVTNSGIVIQTVASQSSGYVFQAQSSTGTVLASIDYQGNLTVQNATITGVLTVNGHLVTANSSGSTTAAVQTNAGATSTCSVTGNDTAGQITLTTGTSGWASGAQCILTFASSYTSAPHPVITPVGTTNPIAVIPTVSSSMTTLTVNFINADTASHTYTWNYFNAQ